MRARGGVAGRTSARMGWFKGEPRSFEGVSLLRVYGEWRGERGRRSGLRWSAESECLEPHITATRTS